MTGVTFNLLQDTTAQANASFSIAIAPDTTKIATAIQSFVTDYNNFLSFYYQQTQVDSSTGAPTSSAVLYNDTTLHNIFNQLSQFASSLVSGLSNGSPDALGDIGITFTDQVASGSTPAIYNKLTINSNILANAITNNLSGVEGVFGYNTTASSQDLGVYSGPLDQTISNYTINVDKTNQVYTAVYTDSHGTQQTVNLTGAALNSGGLSLTAPTTSGLNGLVLIYTGTGNQSGITVSATNGIANMMNSLLTNALAPTSGLLAVDQKAITTDTTSTQTQITSINTQVSNTRSALLAKFSALEAAITSANSALNYLNAQQLANHG